jgi:hypothetical protein
VQLIFRTEWTRQLGSLANPLFVVGSDVSLAANENTSCGLRETCWSGL